MNRADLHWAITATQPHAKTFIGLDRGVVYATDNYTAAIARAADHSPTLALPPSEARDLARFLKPTRKAHESDDIQLVHRGDELHVGLDDGDTAVFECVDVPLPLEYITTFLNKLRGLPVEWSQCVYSPELLARFAKAQRVEGDRLRFYPRRGNDRYGVGLVTVGGRFVGGVAGLTYDVDPGFPLLDSLQTEEKAA